MGDVPHSEDEWVGLDGLALALEDKVAVSSDYVETTKVHLRQEKSWGCVQSI